MEKLVEFQNSLITQDKKVFFSNFNFVVEKNKHVAVIGRSGSGKSALLKSLMGSYKATNLNVGGTTITTNTHDLYKNVCVVLNDTSFICDSVYNELAFSLRNLNLTDTVIKEKVLSIAHYFDFNKFLEYDPALLNNEQKLLLKVMSYLIIEPKVIAIDDLFIFLSDLEKESIFKFVNEKSITMLITTSDIEDTLFVDYIYIINMGKVIAEGSRDSIYTEEKLLNRIGYGLPFMIDLSTQLKLYGTVDKMYIKEKDMVDALWK